MHSRRSTYSGVDACHPVEHQYRLGSALRGRCGDGRSRCPPGSFSCTTVGPSRFHWHVLDVEVPATRLFSFPGAVVMLVASHMQVARPAARPLNRFSRHACSFKRSICISPHTERVLQQAAGSTWLCRALHSSVFIERYRCLPAARTHGARLDEA